MEERTYSVAELSADLERVVNAAFPAELWVQGEIANLSRSRTGHVYLDLADAGGAARVAVVLFDKDRQNVNRALTRAGGGVRMTHGTEIRVRARVVWWRQGGRLQLRMLAIAPAYTLGRLAEDRERLLAALAADGLLDANRRLPVAAVPQRVGLVTSVGSPAYGGFTRELAGCGLAWHVAVADARVQGPDAATGLVRAMRTVAAAGVDVVALVRGGGARTDLATFDDESLARSIATLGVPVFTGIGHEIDRSVADDVAHTAAKTPTACAAGLVGRVQGFCEEVDRAWVAVTGRAIRATAGHKVAVAGAARSVAHRARGAVHVERQRTAPHAQRLGREAPRALARQQVGLSRQVGRVEGSARQQLRARHAALSIAARRVAHRAPRALAEAGGRLEAAATRISALDPARALARGWPVTRATDGRLVRHPDDVAAGDELITTTAGGDLHSRVEPTPESTNG